MTQSVSTDELVEDDHRPQSRVPVRRVHPHPCDPGDRVVVYNVTSQEDSRRSRLLSVLLTGSLAPGHLQTQLEAAARTLLPGRVLHLLRIEGSERRALASPPCPPAIMAAAAIWLTWLCYFKKG